MLKIYNALTQKKEEFKPINDNIVNFYLCGPTVYDIPHLGHGRSAVAFDVIRRYLIYKGYKVNFVTNYTDIDDKMINRANEKNISVSQLADEIIPVYKSDYEALKVLPPDSQPLATEYIDSIIDIIKILEEKGATYKLDDGIYFDISKFPEYGKLSKQKLEDLHNGVRVELNDKKRSFQDFVLWKFEKPGEPSWDSKWGKGRPGWHIECSAMSTSILGKSIDIHGGGADLMFPHHECEIAQSETANGQMFVKYWIHNAFVNVNKEKMSKSLGNFVTLSDLLKKYKGTVLRYLYLQTHHRAPINFTPELIDQAKQSLERIHGFVRNLFVDKRKGGLTDKIAEIIKKADEKFNKGMDNDFDTSEALASVFDLIKNINLYQKNKELTDSDQKAVIDHFKKLDTVFAFLFPETHAELTEELMSLINERETARNNKDWQKADEIRNKLLDRGIVLEDTPKGTIWIRKD
ncbi:cysteine--tRNA ligase [Candidatus Peregrinibacteria bacterium]|nr:cysteine--tRNA ligase [Candidatus Peregrinibacteria bacterium]